MFPLKLPFLCLKGLKILQPLQPFISNGDVSMRVKHFEVGGKKNPKTNQPTN